MSKPIFILFLVALIACNEISQETSDKKNRTNSSTIDNKLIPSLKEGKYGFVNKNGDVKIPHIYDETAKYDFKGYFLVKRNNNKYVIDCNGKEYQYKYKLSEIKNSNRNSVPYEIPLYADIKALILSLKDGKYGYVNVDGEVIIPYKYDEAARFDYYGMFYTERDNKKYLVDTMGVENLYANELSELTNETLVFDISNNKEITEIPEEIFNYTQLKILILSNSFKKLSGSIKKLKNLITLRLGGNHFKKLPEEIGEMEKLKHIYLSGNKLKTLPPKIGGLSNLETLDLTLNPIEFLPKEIGELDKLRVLSLYWTKIKRIPNTFIKLKSLQSVDFQQNDSLDFAQVCNVLTNYPNELNLCIGSQIFEGDENKLVVFVPKQKKIHEELWKIRNIAHLKIASADSTKTIPKAIKNLVNLTTLDLSSNKIEKLPPEIANLKNLKSINLTNNSMRFFPYEILNCENLEELDLGSNDFRSIPKEIAKLSKLKELSLFDNEIKKIPVELFSLKELTSLHLAHTGLTKLPCELGNLTNLKELYLYENKISKLPPEIKKLVNLKIINLAANPMSDKEILMLEKILPNCNIKLSWGI